MYFINLYRGINQESYFHFSLFSIVFAFMLFSGCESDEPDDVDITPPAEVTGISGIIGDGQITLNWTDPADEDFKRVEISYPQGSVPIIIEKGVQTTTITGLNNGTAYIFTIKTLDASGNRSEGVMTSPHTPLAADPDDTTPPAEVTGLGGIVGDRQVTLQWNDPADTDFTKVVITYSPNGTTPIEIGKGTQRAVISGLTNDIEYVFTLKTVDATGNESKGIASEAFIPIPSPAPETTTFTLESVQFKMIAVEGGTFTMGSDERAKGSGTQVSNQAGEHQVTLSSYWIGETEVTRALWNQVMNGSHSNNDQNYPIASVTVANCRTFVQRLNEKARAAGIISDNQSFHLPTEAQWEFAAKGGNESKGYTYAGSNTLSEVGWTSSDGSSVHAIKLKKPNELGIYDMSGNVYEWVEDYAAPYTTEPKTDPCNTTPSNNYIKRGGSFYYNDPYRFTTTYRYFYSATDYTIGLRIALSNKK